MALDLEMVRPIIEAALKEDIGAGDLTTQLIIPPQVRGLGLIFAREEGVLAGIDVVRLVFQILDPEIVFQPQLSDGKKFTYGETIVQMQGLAKNILSGERVALNFLQRMCGIATLTAKFVERVKGTNAKILDTRKTTPLLRILEKYAVRIGGGENHRFNLQEMVLVKDNHLEMMGGVTPSLQRLKETNSGHLFVEIEAKNLSEVEEALAFGVNRIMLDNMNLEMIREAVSIVESYGAKTGLKPELEVSGRVTLENVRAIAETGVDYISVGMLTHSPPAIDLSLRMRRIG